MEWKPPPRRPPFPVFYTRRWVERGMGMGLGCAFQLQQLAVILAM